VSERLRVEERFVTPLASFENWFFWRAGLGSSLSLQATMAKRGGSGGLPGTSRKPQECHWARLPHVQTNPRAQVDTDPIFETVKEQSGGVVAGANITLTNEGTGLSCPFRENPFTWEDR